MVINNQFSNVIGNGQTSINGQTSPNGKNQPRTDARSARTNRQTQPQTREVRTNQRTETNTGNRIAQDSSVIGNGQIVNQIV